MGKKSALKHRSFDSTTIIAIAIHWQEEQPKLNKPASAVEVEPPQPEAGANDGLSHPTADRLQFPLTDGQTFKNVWSAAGGQLRTFAYDALVAGVLQKA